MGFRINRQHPPSRNLDLEPSLLSVHKSRSDQTIQIAPFNRVRIIELNVLEAEVR
jgi:hypothetical protein